VYFEASTLMKGQPARRAKRRAISVFPTPVGPIIRMFFGQNVFGDFRRKLLAADSIAQSDSDGALRGGLPDDILVELGDDFARRHIIESGEKFLPLDGLGAVASRCVGQFFFGLTRHELLSSFDARKQLVVFSRLATRFLPA